MRIRSKFFISLICLGFFVYGQIKDPYAEDILLHTDRDNYLTGDILWFKLWVLQHPASDFPPLSKTVYVQLFDQGGRSVTRQIVDASDGTGDGSFYLPVGFSSGLYTIVAYTKLMAAADSAYYFTKKIPVVNPFIPVVNNASSLKNSFLLSNIISDANASSFIQESFLKINDTVFNRRAPVQIELADEFEDYLRSSMAVRLIDPLFKKKKSVRGNVLKNLQSSFITYDDSILTDYIGRTVSGSLLLKDQNGVSSGSVIGSKVLDKDELLENKLVFFYGDRLRRHLYITSADRRGNFKLAVDDFNQSFYASTTFSSAFEYKIELSSIFKEELKYDLDSLLIREQDLGFLNKRNIYLQIQNREIEKYATSTNQKEDDFIFNNKNSVSYLLDDYNRFRSLGETIKEFIPEVKIVNPLKGEPSLFVLNSSNNTFFESNPLLLFDGVPSFNDSKIREVSALDIERIDIIPSFYSIGGVNLKGIIAFTSKPSSKIRIFEDQNRTKLQSTKKRNFVSIEYKDSLSLITKVPDARTSLYWNPSVSVTDKKEVVFYTSDVPGIYEVEIIAMNEIGETITDYMYFRVQ